MHGDEVEGVVEEHTRNGGHEGGDEVHNVKTVHGGASFRKFEVIFRPVNVTAAAFIITALVEIAGVLGGGATDDDAGPGCEAIEDGVEDWDADAVEEEVDPRGTVFIELRRQVSFIINGDIDDIFVDESLTAIFPASDANDSGRSSPFAQLRRHAADGPSSGAYDDGLPALRRPAHLVDPDVRRQSSRWSAESQRQLR